MCQIFSSQVLYPVGFCGMLQVTIARARDFPRSENLVDTSDGGAKRPVDSLEKHPESRKARAGRLFLQWNVVGCPCPSGD